LDLATSRAGRYSGAATEQAKKIIESRLDAVE